MASLQTSLRRLKQTQSHLQGTKFDDEKGLSVLHGPIDPDLLDQTLGELLDEQCEIRGERECLIVPWTGTRWTYLDLQTQSKILAKGMLAMGLREGDRIGILAGNCEEYVTVFFASGYIGCVLVVLNSTYTASEARHALRHSGE